MEGGSWTNNISWVRGYDAARPDGTGQLAVLREGAQAAACRDAEPGSATRSSTCSQQTSCYRYWGQGIWTDYGAELARRTIEIITHDL